MLQDHPIRLRPALAKKWDELRSEESTLNDDRKQLLLSAAELIARNYKPNHELPLVFICTHNSRRSQFAQVWATVAASYWSLKMLRVFSAGTSVTRVYPAVIETLKKAGMAVRQLSQGDNPRFQVEYAEDQAPILIYSKTISEAIPGSDSFLALMCCDDAADSCPVVHAELGRLRLSYRDPKWSDNTDKEAEAYEACSDLIAVEMMFLMNNTARILQQG